MINQTYLYHGTSVGACIRIQKAGYLIPNSTLKNPVSSFSEKLQYASYYAKMKGGSNGVILRTKKTDDFKLENRIKDNTGYEYIINKPISVDNIDVFVNNKWVNIMKYDFIDKNIIDETYDEVNMNSINFRTANNMGMIVEGKNIGTLYHFTGFVSTYSIILDNQFILADNKEDLKLNNKTSKLDMYRKKYFASMTRNKYFKWNNVRFILDGTKLSNKYIIKPIHFFNLEDIVNQNNKSDYRTGKQLPDNLANQYEERLLSDNQIIDNFLDYVKGIDILIDDKDNLPKINSLNELYEFFHDVILENIGGISEFKYKQNLKENKDKFVNSLIKLKIKIRIYTKLNDKKLNIFDDKKIIFDSSSFTENLYESDDVEIKNNDIITEGKNIGDIYHFVDFSKIEYLLANNIIKLFKHNYSEYLFQNAHNLKSFIKYKDYGLSLTRNKDFGWRDTRIIIDGEKLSNNFKIIPINYFNVAYDTDFRDMSQQAKLSSGLEMHEIHRNQYEERLFHNKNEISNFFSSYVKGIDINLGDIGKFDELVFIKSLVEYFTYNIEPEYNTLIEIFKFLTDNNIKVRLYSDAVESHIKYIFKTVVFDSSDKSKTNIVEINKWLKSHHRYEIEEIKSVNEDIITEGKNLGNIYHFIRDYYAPYVLSTNTVILSDNKADLAYNHTKHTKKLDTYTKYKHFLSIARNKNFDWTNFRLTLDGDKLANKFAFKPIHYYNIYNITQNNDTLEHRDKLDDKTKGFMREYNNQYEERLLSNNDKINNFFTEYVKRIDIIIDTKETIDSLDDMIDVVVKYYDLVPNKKSYNSIQLKLNLNKYIKEDNIRLVLYKPYGSFSRFSKHGHERYDSIRFNDSKIFADSSKFLKQ